MKSALFIAAVAIAASMMAIPTLAGSEEETDCPEGTPRGTICLERIDIVGDVHGPNAMYVINRGRLVHRRHRDDQRFTDEVVESVNQAPF